MSSLPFSLEEKLTSLDSLLKERSPLIKVALQEIHTLLKKQPENVTILSEEQIASIVQSLEQVTGEHFAISATKGTGSTKLAKKLGKADAGAFGF